MFGSVSFVDMSLFAQTSLMCGLAALGIAIFSYLFGDSKSQKLLFVFNVACAIWGFGNYKAGVATNPEEAILAWRFAFFGGIFISPFFYHMGYSIFGFKDKCFLKASYFQMIMLVIAMLARPDLFVSSVNEVFGIQYNTMTFFVGWIITAFALIALVTFSKIIYVYPHLDPNRRVQARLVIIGFGFGFAGGATTLLSCFGFEVIYPAGNFGVVIYAFILCFAIFRYQLFDMQIAIQRTVYYSITAGALSLICVVVFSNLDNWLFPNRFKPSVFELGILILIIALVVRSIESGCMHLLDKHFFKGSIDQLHDYKQALESELERTQRLKSVGILAAGMAHEIRNPIQSLKTFGEYLDKKFNDEDYRSKFQHLIHKETERIEKLTTDLLEFSKPREPNKQKTNLNTLVNEVADLLSNQLMKEGIQHTISMPNEDVFKTVDPDQMKQTLINLILNAKDAMANSRQKQLTIILKEDQISIKDTGCGIPPDRIPHLFDPFYSNKEKGTGLGLAIVHSIMERHGFKISVQSKRNQETLFSIHF